ncbi:Gryzun, putative trafficking through golgi-domain-containing protein [Zychaea mexicana]|uniref:Gryzun, putative trafficking through golgi-domain-containing protein n=1 Tax=Zychaea mexicana TaxID=64656 RepID=UPI0022FE6DED|nr:Gryzun, putative trafficking through golgi-domain-containing protein [Zychaea mexicana]KAI9492284.1 Gryzun, putative trafficking through golgi-domain-containing protein [Zychaea mexicana]
MNTYPAEYLLHTVPVLAVYGLGANATTDSSSSAAAPAPGDSDTTSTSSPPPSEGQRSSATTPASSNAGRHAPSSRAALGSMLQTVFSNKQQFSLYDTPRPTAAGPGTTNPTPPFKTIFVDKDFTLPERTPIGPNLPPPHSNLSPLSHESPLHPDGFMTPLWVKKQLETPSVVVGFYDLWDWSQEPGSQPRPKRETGPLASHVLIDPTEREKDTTLAHEINDRRKYFQDKGIKFAATMILKRQQTDDPAVEERLVWIRKQSGMDNRHSFFVIGPGTQHDVQEFVNSLYRALHEPAVHYYSNRIKKARKKRSKLPSPSMSPRIPDTNEPQPLSIQGWMLRYDYKTGLFQEIRHDIEGAIKSYESAYTLVGDMLAPKSSITPGQTGLPIRSKRWEEARMLVDCISIKICSFYLYMNDPSGALSQLNGHLHMIQSYASVWGTGEQSFEYWAWLSKQYRIFGDLIETAAQHGFKIPIPTAYMAAPGSPNASHPLMSGGGASSIAGCNPGSILQHPGFYYHLAAMCCAERRRRFLEADSATGGDSNEPQATAWETLLANERQIDHSGLTIELLTKSYEQFKKYRNGRMTLYLAAEIAGTYYEAGKFEMALKFFEPIGKTYRKENWNMILTSILRWSLRCAKELKSWERALECLVELMSSDLPMSEQKRQDIQTELFDVLHRQQQENEETPTIPRALAIQMDQINPMLSCHIQFKTRASFVNTPVYYQVALKTGKTSPPAPFRLNSMRILFNDSQYNMLLMDSNSDDDCGLASAVRVDCCHDLKPQTEGEYAGWLSKEADLRVTKNQTKAFEGCIKPKESGELKIVGVCLDIKSPQWHVSLNYDMDHPIEVNKNLSRRKWLEASKDGASPKFTFLDGSGEFNIIKISQRHPRVKLIAGHDAQALLDEHFEFNVTIQNQEQDAIDAKLLVELKDTAGQDSNNKDTRESVAEVAFDRIESGQSATKPVYIHAGDMPGIRVVSLTARYRSADGKDQQQEQSESQFIEKRELLRIPFRSPFESNFKLYAHSDKLSFTTSSPDLGKTEKWLINTSIRCCSVSDLEIERLELKQEVCQLLLRASWTAGHVCDTNYLFRMATKDMTEPQPTIPVGSIIIHWRRSGQDSPYSQTAMPMPTLEFRRQSLSVVADAPDDIHVGEPFRLTYTVYNPTVHLAEYTASVELSDAFVYSGLKILKDRVLPLSHTSYNYTCYPLLAGKVRLPRLKVIAKQQGVEKEVPVEMLGGSEQWPSPFTFVNARRYYN